ncbi:MAG TPA: 2-hydroxyacid dehydrogenase [Gammaproteobacteria bacterium]|jgi:glycerate dehydrogenase|nr:2-hydroxyacid dehydrogenase [Gammaproteobacteria bacterium]
MQAVFLDTQTLGQDIDLQALDALGLTWQHFDNSQPDDVAMRIRDAEVVLANKAIIDRDAIAQAKHLKLICIPATGTNNVDLQAARERGIPVCNCSGYGTAAVSQHVFSLILALGVHLLEYHRAAMAGQWGKSPFFCLLDYPITELAGKTLGIVGYGTLGRAVAKLGEAFGMQILVANRPGADTVAPDRVPLDNLLPQVDVLSLHCPLTPDTENLIGARELGLMRDNALLINCARGGVVDEHALADALRAGTLGGAGVDVLTEEPPINGNVLLDPTIPRLIITPHSAWGSREARQRIVSITADNIRASLAGQPQNVVNP